MIEIARGLVRFFSRSLDILPGKFKVTVLRLLPGKLKKIVIRYGGPKVILWNSISGTIKLKSSPNDDFYQMWAVGELDAWELETLSVWRSLCIGAEVVVDVGAYVGAYGLVAAMEGGAKQVWSFEPNPEAQRVSEENFALNQVSVDIFPVALGSSNGRARLYTPRERTLSSSSNLASFSNVGDWVSDQSVEIRTLDSFLQAGMNKRIKAIKIDVEGYELEVLRGSSKILHEHKPVLILECLELMKLLEIEKYLDRFGYGSGVPLDGIRHTADLNSDEQNSLCARNYSFTPFQLS
jgi:FkbM family methyltransferase